MFRSQKRASNRLVDDLGPLLELYGREEFAPASDRFNLDERIFTFVGQMSKLQLDVPSTDEAMRIAEEIRDAAVTQGGYALLGGCAAIDAFLPDMADTQPYLVIQDAWLAFVRNEYADELRTRLRLKDRVRLAHLYPESP